MCLQRAQLNYHPHLVGQKYLYQKAPPVTRDMFILKASSVQFSHQPSSFMPPDVYETIMMFRQIEPELLQIRTHQEVAPRWGCFKDHHFQSSR